MENPYDQRQGQLSKWKPQNSMISGFTNVYSYIWKHLTENFFQASPSDCTRN